MRLSSTAQSRPQAGGQQTVAKSRMLWRNDIRRLFSEILPVGRSRIRPFTFNFAREYPAVWLAGIIGLALSLIAFWGVQQQVHADRRLEFKWVSQNRHRALDKAINSGLEAVKSIRDLFLVSDQVPPEDFAAFAQSLLERHPGILALAWVPRVPAAQRESFEESARNTVPDFRIVEHAAVDSTVPAGPRDAHFPVLYLEPYDKHERLLGFDFASDAIYRDLLERARDSGEMKVSKRIDLRRADEDEFGFVALLPVYRNSMPTTVEGRRRYLAGFVMGIFGIGELAKAATALLVPRGVEFLIRDESAPEGERFLDFYPSRLSPPESSAMTGGLRSTLGIHSRMTERLQVADRQWVVTYAMTPQFRSAEGFEQGPWVVLASGLLLTVLLSLYLYRIQHDVQLRLRMEEALREREELFREMTEAIQEVFWVQTPDSTQVLYVSPAYETIWGRSCESLYKEPLSFLEGVHPEDQARVRETSLKIPEVLTEQVFRVVRPDGSSRWVRGRAFGMYDKSGKICRIAGIWEDVTALREADEALRESEQQLRSMFHQSPDIIKTVDDTGKILFINRSLPTLSAEDAIGQNSLALLPLEYHKKYEKSLRKLFKNGKEQHFQFSWSDSEWWDLRMSPIWRNDQVIAAMVIETDVTEKRALQAQAVRSARLASLGILAASVAHEINNPNSAIQSNTAILARMFDDALPIIRKYQQENGDFRLGGIPASRALDTLPRLISSVKKSSTRIEQIVGNLKQLVRHDKGNLSQNVEIPEVLEAAISILRNKIYKHTDNFTVDVPEALPLVKGNGQQLEQVFINVILNALEALPDRSHGVHTTAVEEDAGEYVRVIVRDDGIGIAEEDIGRLTEPLYTTKVESGGTGLGLSISYAIIRDHKGKMEFASEPGKGTTVTIRLPVSPSAARAA